MIMNTVQTASSSSITAVSVRCLANTVSISKRNWSCENDGQLYTLSNVGNTLHSSAGLTTPPVTSPSESKVPWKMDAANVRRVWLRWRCEADEYKSRPLFLSRTRNQFQLSIKCFLCSVTVHCDFRWWTFDSSCCICILFSHILLFFSNFN